MCVYNRINGTQGCQSSHVLNTLLKEELDFQGFVVSDWGATYSVSAKTCPFPHLVGFCF